MSELVAVDEHHSTREEAEARRDRIKAGLAALVSLPDDVQAAYQRRDWVALGYPSWNAMCEAEYQQALAALSAVQRREVVEELRSGRMSMRAIAAALGVGVGTIHRDLAAGVPHGTPALESEETPDPLQVVGTDGKHYQPTGPRKAKVTIVDDGPSEPVKVKVRIENQGPPEVIKAKAAIVDDQRQAQDDKDQHLDQDDDLEAFEDDARLMIALLFRRLGVERVVELVAEQDDRPDGTGTVRADVAALIARWGLRDVSATVQLHKKPTPLRKIAEDSNGQMVDALRSAAERGVFQPGSRKGLTSNERYHVNWWVGQVAYRQATTVLDNPDHEQVVEVLKEWNRRSDQRRSKLPWREALHTVWLALDDKATP